MKSYSVLAKYYDRFSLKDCDYESWSQYLCAIANSCNVHRIADVACGTGKMTKLLWEKGFSVVGIDLSQEMLQQATQKCRAVFVRQDMRKLCLPNAVDMAVIVNDGVNYLKPQELVPFLENLGKNLKSGAPLVFDVSSAYKLQQVLGNNVFYFDDDDATLLWTNKSTCEKTQLSLTLFEKSGNTYLRQDEQHTQYIHTQQSVVQALFEGGFDVVEVSADYGKSVQENSTRLTFFAKKRN